jgi:hypothetical protein
MDAGSAFDAAKESVTRFFTRTKKSDIPPRLLHPVRFPFGEFEFQLEGGGGESAEILASRDLKRWDTLDGVTIGKQPIAYTDKGAGEFNARFYRASAGGKLSNVVGFAVRELPSGYSMISNPFTLGINTIANLLPTVPDGTVLNKFSVMAFQLSKNEFSQGRWSNPNETLGPGEGALLFNPADSEISLKFIGEVTTSATSMSIHQGMSMRSSMLPAAGRLDAELGFPIADGDVVSLYSSNEEKYLEHRFEGGKWKGEPPFIRLCEAFWIAKNESAIWAQKVGE